MSEFYTLCRPSMTVLFQPFRLLKLQSRSLSSSTYYLPQHLPTFFFFAYSYLCKCDSFPSFLPSFLSLSTYCCYFHFFLFLNSMRIFFTFFLPSSFFSFFAYLYFFLFLFSFIIFIASSLLLFLSLFIHFLAFFIIFISFLSFSFYLSFYLSFSVSFYLFISDFILPHFFSFFLSFFLSFFHFTHSLNNYLSWPFSLFFVQLFSFLCNISIITLLTSFFFHSTQLLKFFSVPSSTNSFCLYLFFLIFHLFFYFYFYFVSLSCFYLFFHEYLLSYLFLFFLHSNLF